MVVRENECQVSQNYILHRKFQNFTCVITMLVTCDIHFLRLPWEIFFGVTTNDFKPFKNVNKNAIFFKLFGYKVFVHGKLRSLNFLVFFFLFFYFFYFYLFTTQALLTKCYLTQLTVLTLLTTPYSLLFLHRKKKRKLQLQLLTTNNLN